MKLQASSSKIRELSDNSTGSLTDSQNVVDIFSERLSSPDCLAILVDCIKNVENQIVVIFSKIEETKSSQIKGEQHLLQLSESTTFISKKFDEYKKKIEREKIMTEIQKEIKDISATIQSFKVSLDRQE